VSVSELQSLANEYLAFAFAADPIEATRLGVHDHDHLLGECGDDAMAERIARNQSFHDRLLSYGSPPVRLIAERMLDCL
jgi:hypothetical protein